MVRPRYFITLGLLLISPGIGRAELRFSAPTADLGELRGGPVYQHRFEFINESKEPIEIRDIRLGCGCLQPVLEKRSFQPGEKGVLTMHIRTLGQLDGPRTWQARVVVRQEMNEQEIVLTLAATIRNEITIEPSILAMTVETTLRAEVTITDLRPAPAKITAVLASTPAIRVMMEARTGKAVKVILEVSGAELRSEAQEEMLNIYTDDPNYRHLELPITLRKAKHSAVSATPDKVEFRAASSGSKLVRLRAAGDQKVAVDRIEISHGGLKCTWASGPGNDATLKLSFDAQLMPSTIRATDVRVHLASPSSTTLVIPVLIGRE